MFQSTNGRTFYLMVNGKPPLDIAEFAIDAKEVSLILQMLSDHIFFIIYFGG